MNHKELLAIIARDKDSKHQFKTNVTNETSLAAEMVAFSNTLGGMLIIGVADNGSISGLNREDMGRLSNLVSNAASQQVKPPVNLVTENIALDDGLVMVVHIDQGISKPYMDKNGVIWVKNGADKRSDQVLSALSSAPLSATELMKALGLEIKSGAFKRAIKDLLANSQIEYTLPYKPLVAAYKNTDG